MAGSTLNLVLLCNILCVVFVAAQRSDETNLDDLISSTLQNTSDSSKTSILTTGAPLAKGVSFINIINTQFQ